MANENMHVDDDGLKFIAREEGTIYHVYRDQLSLETCCTGHLLTPQDKASGVFNGQISPEKCQEVLAKDVQRFENAIKKYITVEISQPMFNSLASLLFNCGTAPIVSGSLGKVINAQQWDKVPAAMELWCKGGGKVLPFLLARRKREVAVFMQGVAMLNTPAAPDPEPAPEPQPDPPADPTPPPPPNDAGTTTVPEVVIAPSQSKNPLQSIFDLLTQLFGGLFGKK